MLLKTHTDDFSFSDTSELQYIRTTRDSISNIYPCVASTGLRDGYSEFSTKIFQFSFVCD